MKAILSVINASVVRPVVTVGFSAAFIYGFVVDKVPVEAFVSLTGMVIGFWFMRREDEKRNGPPPGGTS